MCDQRIFIVGASGHGRVALDAVRCAEKYDVVGFIDTYVEKGTHVAGLEVLGSPSDISGLSANFGIGGYFLAISDNCTRSKMNDVIAGCCQDLAMVTIIHPSAVVARDAEIGAGSLILAGAVVGTNCRLGVGTIVNTRASLDHDGELGDYASLLPGVVTGGNVKVGRFSCVCLGAHVGHGVRIGEHCMIGAGSVVLRDVEGYTLSYGVPARPVRKREAGERHF